MCTGLLVLAFALGMVIGAPLMTVATPAAGELAVHFDRRPSEEDDRQRARATAPPRHRATAPTRHLPPAPPRRRATGTAPPAPPAPSP